MSPESSSLIEYLALDGPIGPAPALLLAVVLLVLFGWSLWRERTILGRQHLVLFWVLRAVALATVLWMLLAPVNVRVETSTTRQAVALITDVSGSMETVDPFGSADEIRWSVAAESGERPWATKLADEAVVAMGMARGRVQAAMDALQQHHPESALAAAAESANQAVRRTLERLQQLRSLVADGEASAPVTTRIERLQGMLSGPQLAAFDELCAALQKGRMPAERGWRESLPDLQHRLSVIHRSLQELARSVAQAESSQFEQQQSELLNRIASQPRRVRATSVVQHLDEGVLNTVRETADVEFLVFDQAARRVSGTQTGGDPARPAAGPPSHIAAGSTDLAAVLQELNRERQQPLAAVFLLTDAAHNQPEARSPVDVAARLGQMPVHVVPIGNTQHVRDVIVQSVSAPEVAMRNDAIVIEVNLQAHDCEGEVGTLLLLQDGEVVDFREVLFDSKFASRSVRFEQRMPVVGRQQFQIAVAPLSGELTDENNYDEFEVNVTRSDIKVLLADELPRWEYRYLTQLFRRDQKVECDELLFHPRMIATGRREASKTVPITVDEWDQYDVVMLGDLPTDHLPVAAQQSLTLYLKQRGGTLVIIAGPAAMPQAYLDHPLQDLLPVLPVDGTSAVSAGGFAFHVTAAGQKHHALMIGETLDETRSAWEFVNRFAPLHDVSEWRRPKPSAETLIAAVDRRRSRDETEAADNAFLCWHPVGRGKVVYLSGPDTYRLRFLRGDRLHYRFWGQLLRWAIATDLSAGSQYVRIRTDKTRYNTREKVQVTVRLSDGDGEPVLADELTVRAVSAEDERVVPLAADPQIPGAYRAALTSLPPGVFRIEPEGSAIAALPTGDGPSERASASFTVQADLPQELVDTRCNRGLARQIAEVTGGQVLPPTAIEEVLALTNLEPIVSETTQRRPLWLQWKYLWIVFGCLQLEWVIRKWNGWS